MSDAPAAPVTENGVPPAAQETVVEETPGFKVFAGNLAYTTTDEGLKTFFSPIESEILSAQVIFRGTRSAGYGFVAVATAEAAQKAVELLDKKELDGRQVIVEVAKPADQKEKKQKRFNKRRTGRRGSKSVPGEVSEAEANGDASAAEKTDGGAPATDEAAKPKKKKKANVSPYLLFTPSCSLRNILQRKPKRKAATSEGEGATSGNEAAPAEGAEDAAPKKQPKPRKPKAPRPPRPAGEDPVGEPSKSVLFVANLGFNIDDAGLAQLFTDAGLTVNSARIVRRRWGKPRKSKGYGFVDVGDEEEQKKAIEALNGKEVGGRAIAVKIAVNSQTEEGAESDAPAPAAAEPEAEVEVEVETEVKPDATPEATATVAAA
ncbi:RNA-binding domain-containing protein [Obba rivulosa]|uniref:RNA-binding domain-containing protein n=1 Tax=Obba rivulosa TaxID=1052685 RepID=A0A8E2AUD2_9APHY|nr:RNA-binding domain-containing protein [Obba rivulosa]